MAFNFLLTYAGIPFSLDKAQAFRAAQSPYRQESEGEKGNAPRKYQPEEDILDEIDRMIPFSYLQDIIPPPGPSFRAHGIAQLSANTIPKVRVGDFYYPVGASRWGVFRGLVTSSQYKAMLALTAGNTAKTFIMACNPTGGPAINTLAATYTVSTPMYMLPGRPLGETAGTFDGLYLITLVDERYFFQGNSTTFQVTSGSTWESLITEISTDLGITITYSAIPTEYAGPEPDSSLWTCKEASSSLLDAIAFNLGREVVRNLDGTYELLTPEESYARVQTNFAATNGVRTAGGDMLFTGTVYPAGNLNKAKEVILPATITVTFPKYDVSSNPVPHYVNPRNVASRNTAWDETSYGSVFSVNVPISSGGLYVSGLTGMSQDTCHTTSKALMSGTETPLNLSGITSLAIRLATDKYNTQVFASLDEVFPGTLAWEPEGLHDVIWTYSAKARQACVRVMRSPWNIDILDFQHGTLPLSGFSRSPAGVGGHTVSQAWRDQWQVSGNQISGIIGTGLGNTVVSGDTDFRFNSVSYFPTYNRWKGKIDNEIILFEGTSGGVSTSSGFQVGVVKRGIDGSLVEAHAPGAVITQVTPDTTYGVNVVTTEKGLFTLPDVHSSGGLTGVRLLAPVKTVTVAAASGNTINGFIHYPGFVNDVNPTIMLSGSSQVYSSGEQVWIVERNNNISSGVVSGKRYLGQMVGWSASGAVKPVYLVDHFVGEPGSGSVVGATSITVQGQSLFSQTIAPLSLSGVSSLFFYFSGLGDPGNPRLHPNFTVDHSGYVSGAVGTAYISQKPATAFRGGMLNAVNQIIGGAKWHTDDVVFGPYSGGRDGGGTGATVAGHPGLMWVGSGDYTLSGYNFLSGATEANVGFDSFQKPIGRILTSDTAGMEVAVLSYKSGTGAIPIKYTALAVKHTVSGSIIASGDGGEFWLLNSDLFSISGSSLPSNVRILVPFPHSGNGYVNGLNATIKGIRMYSGATLGVATTPMGPTPWVNFGSGYQMSETYSLKMQFTAGLLTNIGVDPESPE